MRSAFSFFRPHSNQLLNECCKAEFRVTLPQIKVRWGQVGFHQLVCDLEPKVVA